MAISKPHLSSKHIDIKKDNTMIFVAIGIAVFITIFGITSGRALIGQASYHQRVITEKQKSLEQAKANLNNAEDLEASYLSFAGEAINILGGDPEGEGLIAGSNPKIVLDALPGVYDYPALSSSIEKILLDNGYQIERIGGSEDESLSSGNGSTTISASGSSGLTEIPYPISFTADVSGAQRLLGILERSIRPFYVENISFSGSDQNLSVDINMKTFYQPQIQFEAGSKVVD
jgi:hypothetical protein